jgi:protein-tyrosine phosphatase
MAKRDYAFDGVVNFRDFGGHQTKDGRRVVMGRLFRSAHYNGVSPEDAAALDALGVKFLVDLRQQHERTQHPNRWAPARTVFHYPPEAPAPLGVSAPRPEQTAEVGRAAMRAAYQRYPYEARFLALFRDLFHGLADEGGPVIVHCTAGKDRTGIACALVLDALGVDQETIFADYLLTNANMDVAERARLVRARLGADVSDEAIAPLLGVEANYLQAGLDVIIEKSGSLGNYVETALGVSPQQMARLRDHLLE